MNETQDSTRTVRRRRGQRLGAAAGVVALIAGAFALSAMGRPRGTGGGSHQGAVGGVTGPPMCGHGPAPHDAASLSQARGANDANMIFSTWCGEGLLEGFSSGIEIIVRPNDLPDPVQMFQAMAKEDGPAASLGVVQGVPALEDDALRSGGKLLGSVDFVKNGLHILVRGNGQIPLPELIKVAESITPEMPTAVVTGSLASNG